MSWRHLIPLSAIALSMLAASGYVSAAGGFTAGPATETSKSSGETKAVAPTAEAAKPANSSENPAFKLESKEPEAKSGGGWSNMMRSVTGFLGGGRAATGEPGATATIGIRGLSASQLGGSQPNFNEVQKMEGQAVSQGDAASFAQSGNLHPQTVPMPAVTQPQSGRQRNI